MIDTSNMTTEALEEYDAMMIEASLKVAKFARLSVAIWTDVLHELDRRGRVKLISGTYEDVGNALIQRME